MLAAGPQHNNNMLLCHNIILLVAFSRAGIYMLVCSPFAHNLVVCAHRRPRP